MENVRILMDRLKQQAAARRDAAATPGVSAPPAPALEGLAFRPGDRVVDLSTGHKGKVIAGARGDTHGTQVFEIELEGARTVYRMRDELAPDTLPRSPERR